VNPPKTRSALRRIAVLLLASLSLRLSADVLLTTNGARIVGKITGIHAGVVTVQTDYAGEIKVKQGLVTSIETDRPVAVKLASGARVIGTVTPTPDGRLKVSGREGDVYTTMDHVAASWAAADEDPDVVARRKKWSYVAGVDISGEKGNTNQLGTAMNLKADRKGPDDELQLFTDYDRQVTNGEKSVDQFKVGADYSDNFSAATSWYVRDEGGYDRVLDITFEDTAAAGLGYDFVKDKIETLTGRAGLSYRYDEYSADADTPELSAFGADFEVQYTRMVGKSQLTDKISYLPEFQDAGAYVVNHDFGYVIPITKSLWKLAIGVTNSYNSRPVPGVEKLETIYFTRLELAWGQK
jgi:putative salt-induced outer membrane protein YdiY